MKLLRLGLLGASALLFLSSGAWGWQTNINGTANDFELAFAVTVDARGDVVAAGSTVNTGTSYDFTVVKLAGATGVELWRQAINGTTITDDQAFAVTVDARGDVVAAGYTTNSGTFTDFTVVKLRGRDGRNF